MEQYDPQAIERKWQQIWADSKAFEVSNPAPGEEESFGEKTYVLEMLPYPSGEPHVGHLKNYALGDAIAHYRRRRGLNDRRATGANHDRLHRTGSGNHRGRQRAGPQVRPGVGGPRRGHRGQRSRYFGRRPR